MYSIEFTHNARKQLRALDRKDQRRVLERIERLADNPRPTGARKMQGSAIFYRLRVGDCRVIYSIDDGVLLVLVLKIGHRGDVYKK